jgi:hypothetical protein
MVHICRKKNIWKEQRLATFKDLSALNMQKHFLFVSIFEHVKFLINGKYSKKLYENPNYYDSLVIFQTCKNAILKSVDSLGWLLWLCFYPCSFEMNGRNEKRMGWKEKDVQQKKV